MKKYSALLVAIALLTIGTAPEGSGGVAFVYHHDAWHEANGPDIFTKATLVGKATFEDMFGKLPPIEDVLPWLVDNFADVDRPDHLGAG